MGFEDTFETCERLTACGHNGYEKAARSARVGRYSGGAFLSMKTIPTSSRPPYCMAP
jgi:hypothetical protein